MLLHVKIMYKRKGIVLLVTTETSVIMQARKIQECIVTCIPIARQRLGKYILVGANAQQ
jgi:hypothetical protein